MAVASAPSEEYLIPPPEYPTLPTNGENAFIKYNLQFSEQSIRAAFVKKVFTLVSIMLLVVTGFCIAPIASEDVRYLVQNSFPISIASMVVFFVLAIAMVCVPSLRRNFPINIILLTVFTLSAAVMIMFITAFIDVQSVLICLSITTVCCTSIIIFSTTTSYDLTSTMGAIYMLSMISMSFGLFTTLFTLSFHCQWFDSVYAGLAALLLMIYLAIDVQLLMGCREYQLSPEDYVAAAMLIFLDVLDTFLRLLIIIARIKQETRREQEENHR